MKLSIQNLIITLGFISTIILFYTVLIEESNIERYNTFIIFTFLLNLIITLYLLFNWDRYAYSLSKIFFIFNLVFLVVIPLLQYLFNLEPWSQMVGPHQDKMYIYANIIISIWTFSFLIGYKLSFKKQTYTISFSCKYILLSILQRNLIFFIGVISAIIFNYIMYHSNEVSEAFKSRLLISYFFKSVALMSLALLIVQYLKKRSLNLTILILINFISFFSLVVSIEGGSRNFLAIVIFGLLFTIKRTINSSLIFIYIMLGSLIVFPLIGSFRGGRQFSYTNILDVWNMISIDGILKSGNFDAYSMLINIMNYVDLHGITYGRQLFGALFFYIPRSLWHDKPIGSGAYVADKLGFYFTNVSAPLVGEGYINFGLIGVIIFGMMTGFLIKKFDKLYWGKVKFNSQTYLYYIYPFMLGITLFLMRGDLMSSTSFIVGLIMSSYIYFLFITKLGKYTKC